MAKKFHTPLVVILTTTRGQFTDERKASFILTYKCVIKIGVNLADEQRWNCRQLINQI